MKLYVVVFAVLISATVCNGYSVNGMKRAFEKFNKRQGGAGGAGDGAGAGTSGDGSGENGQEEDDLPPGILELVTSYTSSLLNCQLYELMFWADNKFEGNFNERYDNNNYMAALGEPTEDAEASIRQLCWALVPHSHSLMEMEENEQDLEAAKYAEVSRLMKCTELLLTKDLVVYAEGGDMSSLVTYFPLAFDECTKKYGSEEGVAGELTTLFEGGEKRRQLNQLRSLLSKLKKLH